jgi:hypothetical protein
MKATCSDHRRDATCGIAQDGVIWGSTTANSPLPERKAQAGGQMKISEIIRPILTRGHLLVKRWFFVINQDLKLALALNPMVFVAKPFSSEKLAIPFGA